MKYIATIIFIIIIYSIYTRIWKFPTKNIVNLKVLNNRNTENKNPQVSNWFNPQNETRVELISVSKIYKILRNHLLEFDPFSVARLYEVLMNHLKILYNLYQPKKCLGNSLVPMVILPMMRTVFVDRCNGLN